MSDQIGVIQRRRFLRQSMAMMAAGLLPVTSAGWAARTTPWGDGTVTVLSDGYLSLPGILPLPNATGNMANGNQAMSEDEVRSLFAKYNLPLDSSAPDCNVTLWQAGDRLVLFDVGAGPNFMPSAGKLLENMDAAGIDPADVTDVIFTHAHPDHLWGLLDDFDELICPEADYHMPRREWEYWGADGTLSKTPENRKSFVVGAQNRFQVLQDRISLFDTGQEVIAGIEAMDTRGHTPGHTSFALHSGSDSLVLLGDCITNVALSFEKPKWLSRNDQDPQQASVTRLKLLDRLAHDKSMIVGFHLPHPGLGRVEVRGSGYRFEPVAG